MTTRTKFLLYLFREFWLKHVTQTKPEASHHHPIWGLVAEALGDLNHKQLDSEEYAFVVQGKSAAAPWSLLPSDFTDKQLDDILANVAAIEVTGTKVDGRFGTPWYILDVSTAEPDVNWPGELLAGPITDYSEVRPTLLRLRRDQLRKELELLQ